MKRSDEILPKIEKSRPYVVRDGILTTTDEMARGVDVGLCKSSKAGFASGLVEIFKVSTTKRFGTCAGGSCGMG